MSFSNTRTAESSGANARAALVFIAISVCLDYLAQSISFPILPRLAQRLLGGDLAAAARWVGVLEVAWAIPQFFAAPLLGMLSDRIGRRPVIVISLFGVAAELAMNALATNMVWLLAGRILCGFTCGAQAASMAYVADVTPAEGRTRAYGWLNAALWTGIILGPALGGLLSGINIRAPFWVAAGVALLGGLYGFIVLPESLAEGSRAPMRWSNANPAGAVRLLLERRGLLALGFAQLLMWLAFQGTSNMMVLYTAYRYGWSPLVFGIFATMLAVANIVVQAGLSGRIAEWIGERRAVLVGFGWQVVGFTASGIAPTGRIFVAANLSCVFGNIAGPALQSLMTAKVAPDEQGRLQGAIGSISSLTSIAAPIAFTQIFSWAIVAHRAPRWSGVTILAGAALSLIAYGLVLFSTRR